MLYPEKSMVNMMESSLTESMVQPNTNNIYDPMVSKLTIRQLCVTQICSVSHGGQIVMFHVMFTPSTKMHTQGFHRKNL